MRNVIILSLVMVVGVLSAAEVTFTNGGGDNDWHNPANWSGGAVPCVRDNVTIPEGYDCQVTGGHGFAQTNSFTNNGNLTLPNGGDVTACGGDLTNNGSINIGSGGDDGSFNTYFNFINNGSIEGGSSVTINVEGTLNNNGSIHAGYGSSGEGGNILCNAGFLNNQGTIQGGDAIATAQDGGRVDVNTFGDFNNDGTIVGGNGSTDGNGGIVHIKMRNMRNTGGVSSGYSDGGWRASLFPVAADVYFIGDSICIDTGDSSLDGGTFHIRGRKLIFQNIDIYAGLTGENAIEIYTIAGGSADFSGTHTNSALFAVAGGIDIYSDDVIAPTEGMDYICSPSPTIHASDASIIDGNISAWNEFEFAGNSGNVKVFMQNLSTSAKVMYYDISSSKGWLTATSGSTPSHAPFEFDSVLAGFTIPPSTADSIIDTVTAILSIEPSFTETTSCIIHCMGDSAAVYVLDNNSLPSCLTVQAFPNPFNSSISITTPADAMIEIYDITGSRVWGIGSITVNDAASPYTLNPIPCSFIWQPDETIASGLYLVRATTEDGSTVTKRIFYIR